MFSSFPAAWVLVALPFLSALVISQVPALSELAARRYRVMWPVGIAGLLLLFAELVGWLPAATSLPVMFLAGAVSGFSLFWPGRDAGDEGYGEGGSPEDAPLDRPSHDGPPLAPLGHRPPDWDRFDRMRADWERRPSRPRPPSRKIES
jgi:hypothetical protein